MEKDDFLPINFSMNIRERTVNRINTGSVMTWEKRSLRGYETRMMAAPTTGRTGDARVRRSQSPDTRMTIPKAPAFTRRPASSGSMPVRLMSASNDGKKGAPITNSSPQNVLNPSPAARFSAIDRNSTLSYWMPAPYVQVRTRMCAVPSRAMTTTSSTGRFRRLGRKCATDANARCTCGMARSIPPRRHAPRRSCTLAPPRPRRRPP